MEQFHPSNDFNVNKLFPAHIYKKVNFTINALVIHPYLPLPTYQHPTYLVVSCLFTVGR